MIGGQIQVFSTEGEGSTFLIHLSLVVDKEKEGEFLQTYSAEYFKSVRTLVLDKTGASMNLMESYLGAFGMHCELTSSPESALSMLQVALKADDRYKKLHVIILTNFDEIDNEIKGLIKFKDI